MAAPTREYKELGNLTSTGTLLVRDGIIGNPGGSGVIVGVVNVFAYVFTGAEGVHIAFLFGVPRVDVNFAIFLGPQTEPDTFGFSTDTYSVNGFNLRTSAQVPAGRKVSFLVVELQ